MSQYYDKEQVDKKLSQNLVRVEEVGEEVKVDVTKDVKAEVETFTASTTTKVNNLEGKVNQLDSKTTELNSNVAVYNQKVDNLNSAVSSETSSISIKPTDTSTYLATLPNAVYRAASAGTYQFTTLPDFDVVVNKVVPEGYSVKFLKDTSGWSVAVVEKMPTLSPTGVVEEGNTEAVSGGELYKEINPIDDVLFEVTPKGTNFISELTSSDINNTELWGVGYLTDTNVINSQSHWRYSKKFYKLEEVNLDFKLGIYGNGCINFYDEDFNFITSLKKGSTSETTYFIQNNYVKPVNSVYVKISFNPTNFTTDEIYIKSSEVLKKPKSDVFLETSTVTDIVNPIVNNEILNFGLSIVNAGTQFVSELINSTVEVGSIWKAGFYNEKGGVTNAVGWYSTVKKYPLYKGSVYKIDVNINGNAKALILNLDGSVRKVLSSPSDRYEVTLNELITEDCYFVTSQNSTANPSLPTTQRISVTNLSNLYDTAITSKNIDSYLPDASNNVIRKTFLDTYRPKKKRPIVTIISDDGRLQNLDWFVPILDEFGVKATFAIVGNWTRRRDIGEIATALSSEQLRTLYYEGHDIASHTWTHTENWNTALTMEEIEEEMSRTKIYLERITTTPVNMFISPFGIRSASIDNIISKYYDANFISWTDSDNQLPLDNYFIKRESFDTSETTYDQKWETKLKPAIDEAILNNSWLVFAVHPQYTQYYTNNPNYMARRDELRTLLQYCQDKGVEVTTAKKGYEYYKNHVDIGVKRVNSSYYKLGMDMTEENINYF